MKYCLSTLLLSALIVHGATAAELTPIELSTDSGHWQSLEYGSIPANQLSQTSDGLKITIAGSASPLIYVFDQATVMSHIEVKGQLSGLPTIPAGKTQGDKGADDFAFRLGLVLAGDKKLGAAQRLFAADWVKTLYGLAPKGTGISHVQFLNLANSPGPSWQQRAHPASKGLFIEQVVGMAKAAGPFELNYQLPEPARVVAFWISADGDDTNSNYSVDLQRLAYE